METISHKTNKRKQYRLTVTVNDAAIAVVSNPGIPLKTLAERLGINDSTMRSHIRKARTQGLIVWSDEDRRYKSGNLHTKLYERAEVAELKEEKARKEANIQREQKRDIQREHMELLAKYEALQSKYATLKAENAMLKARQHTTPDTTQAISEETIRAVNTNALEEINAREVKTTASNESTSKPNNGAKLTFAELIAQMPPQIKTDWDGRKIDRTKTNKRMLTEIYDFMQQGLVNKAKERLDSIDPKKFPYVAKHGPLIINGEIV